MKFPTALPRPRLHRCRSCGATNYGRVIARDALGAMRATDRYQCSGCSIVFSDPRVWMAADDLPPPHRRAAEAGDPRAAALRRDPLR